MATNNLTIVEASPTSDPVVDNNSGGVRVDADGVTIRGLTVQDANESGFLVTGAGVFGWLSITSLLFVIYAPRGPKPDNIEGLNALEIRVIPITYLLVSTVLFLVFLVALNQYEEAQEAT